MRSKQSSTMYYFAYASNHKSRCGKATPKASPSSEPPVVLTLKADLIAMLGIKVYPAEDLKSRRITRRLNLCKTTGEGERGDFAKVVFGGPSWTRTRHLSLIRTFSDLMVIAAP